MAALVPKCPRSNGQSRHSDRLEGHEASLLSRALEAYPGLDCSDTHECHIG